MKKFVSILLSLVSVICLPFAFSGCKEEEAEVKGEFYWLKDAYSKKLISVENLKNIAYYYNSMYYDGEIDYGGNFKPIPLSPASLSSELRESIEITYCFKNDISKDMYDEVNVSEYYYGKYDNCYVVELNTSCLVGGDPKFYQEYILDNVKFFNYHEIGVWIEV